MPIDLNEFYTAITSYSIYYYDREENSIVIDQINHDKFLSFAASKASPKEKWDFISTQKPSGAYDPKRYPIIYKHDVRKEICTYIDRVADESYKALLDLPGNDIIHAFHVKVTDDGLYEDWIEFQYELIMDLAAKWCDQHNIEYYRTPIEWE